MKKFKSILFTTTILAATVLFTACGSSKNQASDEIHVVSREDGSGTREAFSEITKLISKDASKKKDNTVKDAIVQNSTEAVMSTVARDKDAIGYISLGSLNNKVKDLEINGVKANAQNIKSGKYTLARPFILVYKDKLNKLSKDFLNYIESVQGQEIVSKNGYIAFEGKENYKASKMKGHIAIAGSTSITPLMEKIIEAYEKINPQVTIDIQSNGSSAGINDTLNSGADIGMSSRNLKNDEKSKLKEVKIAIDGIAVIVNKDNKLNNISLEELNNIYSGKLTKWSQVK